MKYQVLKITHRGESRVEAPVGELLNSHTEADALRTKLDELWQKDSAFDPNYVEFKTKLVES